jgi:hypothetical protein
MVPMPTDLKHQMAAGFETIHQEKANFKFLG